MSNNNNGSYVYWSGGGGFAGHSYWSPKTEEKPSASGHKTSIVVFRHGESVWNKQNRFTGWVDVSLSDRGREEAQRAGELLQRSGIDFSSAVMFTSGLKRAQETASYVASKLHVPGLVPVAYKQLNERDYGKQNGLNKTEFKTKHGEDFLNAMRRGYEPRPEGGESLKDVHIERVRPFYEKVLKPLIADPGVNTIVIGAHGNSLRALDMELGASTTETVDKVEFKTGEPVVYELDGDGKLLQRYTLEAPVSEPEPMLTIA